MHAYNFCMHSWCLIYPRIYQRLKWSSVRKQKAMNEVRRHNKARVSKKNTKSKVRKYFGFVPNEDGSGPSNSDSPKCKLCLKNVSARWANTSNLLNHLKLHHISEYREIAHTQSSIPTLRSSRRDKFKKDGQQTLEQCVEKVKKFSTNSKEHRKLNEAVTNCLVRGVMPFGKVKTSNFVVFQ